MHWRALFVTGEPKNQDSKFFFNPFLVGKNVLSVRSCSSEKRKFFLNTSGNTRVVVLQENFCYFSKFSMCYGKSLFTGRICETCCQEPITKHGSSLRYRSQFRKNFHKFWILIVPLLSIFILAHSLFLAKMRNMIR